MILLCTSATSEVFMGENLDVNSTYKRMLGLFVIIKMHRFIYLLQKNRQLNTVIKVFSITTESIVDVFFMALIITFLFATIGIIIFGGNVTTATPQQYFERYGTQIDSNYMFLNFNDYFHSAISLFCVVFTGWS